MDLNKVTPLPLWYYFSPFARAARRQLFVPGYRYAGSEPMVPKGGDYRVSEALHDGYMLVRDKETAQVRLLSNVCRHKQALLVDPALKGSEGRSGNISTLPRERFFCPMHRWSYDREGKHCSAPHFAKETRIDLPTLTPRSWNGLLFSGKNEALERLFASLALVGHSGTFDPKEFDLSRYLFAGLETYTYANSAELMLETYLDVNHDPCHRSTFLQVVDWDKLVWEFGDAYNVQIVPWQKRAGKTISEKYQKLREQVDEYYPEGPPYGALWMTIFPNVMVEWYPMMLVVSTVYPENENYCRSVNHVEYYVKREWASDRERIFAVVRAAYDETAHEDEEICESIERGRSASWQLGEGFIGPTHPYRELGIAHFHDYVYRTVGAELDQAALHEAVTDALDAS